MESIRILPHYTYNDYLHWEGKWELIYGIPYAMSPMPSPKHQWIGINLGTAFRDALRNCKYCKAFLPIDYKISEDTILQPDLLVVCKSIEKNFLDFPPALVIEILSPSTASKDRLYKFNIYQQQQIPFYIIVDTEKEELEIYELKNEKYNLINKGKEIQETFHFDTDCTATINFAEIWK